MNINDLIKKEIGRDFRVDDNEVQTIWDDNHHVRARVYGAVMYGGWIDRLGPYGVRFVSCNTTGTMWELWLVYVS